MTIDYKLLLAKYMNHVGNEEGTYFIDTIEAGYQGFTEEEISELNRLQTVIDVCERRGKGLDKALKIIAHEV